MEGKLTIGGGEKLRGVVVISGKAQAGKDTLANALRKEVRMRNNRGNDIKTLIESVDRGYTTSFAEPLKRLVLDYVPGVMPENVYGSNDEKNAVIPGLSGEINTARKLLETIGTAWFRENLRDDIWVQNLLKRLSLHRNYHHVFIPDCRFPNEVDIFAQGLLSRDIPVAYIRLTRNVLNSTSAAETALDGYDWHGDHPFPVKVLDNEYLTIDETVKIAVRWLDTVGKGCFLPKNNAAKSHSARDAFERWQKELKGKSPIPFNS